MSLKNIRGRHLRLIAVYSARHAVRTGTGLVFLLVLLIFGLTVGAAVMSPVESLEQQAKLRGQEASREDVLEQMVEMGRSVVEWAVGSREAEEPANPSEGEPDPGVSDSDVEEENEEARRWASYLLDDKPAILSAILLVVFFGHPFVVTFGGFNLVSSDVRSRGIRYQLLRTERTNIFLGRYIGTLVYATLALALVLATIVLYVGFRLQTYSAWPMISWGVHGFLALVLITLPYLALCSWISALIDSPMASLVVSKLIIGGVPLVAFIGKKSYEPLVYLKYALPWGIQNYLFHPDLSLVVIGVVGCLGYTALFLFLGLRHFNRCDL